MGTIAVAADLVIDPRLRKVNRHPEGYWAQYRHLRFLVSVALEQDDRRWLHASVSRRDRTLPTYEDLALLKDLCVGEHRTALQVFPPASKHVSPGSRLGVEVLHLWSCLDGDVTPDFTRGGESI